MNKRVCIVCVALVASITLIPIFTTAEQGTEPQGGANRTSPPAKGKEQQQPRNGETTNRENPESRPTPAPVTLEGPVTVINQHSAEEQDRKAQDQAKTVWDKVFSDLIFNPSEWPAMGLVLVGGLTAAFAFAAYLAARRQANAAEKHLELATTPRLHVEEVRAIDFEVGMQPIFLVKIINAGPVAAERVAVTIRVEPSKRYGGAKYSDGAHFFTIPANGYREEFIRVAQALTDDLINDLNNHAWELRVTGDFTYEGIETKYCYKYNPSRRPRPEGLPEFIPCEFKTERTIIVMATGSAMMSATGQMSPKQNE